jgi:hypothetical protein
MQAPERLWHQPAVDVLQLTDTVHIDVRIGGFSPRPVHTSRLVALQK